MLARPEEVIAPGIYDGISARLTLEVGFNCLYQRIRKPMTMSPSKIHQAARTHCSIDPTIPLIVDADTGYKFSIIARTLVLLHIEDRIQTKRCGHLLGKQLVSVEEFVTRIRAAVIAQEEAISRSKPASAAGADLLFYRVNFIRVLLDFVTGGFTPNFTAKEARAIGVKIIIYLPITVIPKVHAVWVSLQLLKRTADVNSSRGMGLDEAIKLDATG
ncbi:oxaloacetate acetylhydrolase [Lentinula boryana]|uniref:methylisocitrate lyase n=1 Tax=Lentinula boryana TaxID=40481 RepID=A0ABQ8PW60_9AGAR|nr:oxaloacetate acetylhydrolase [Lentinula boryana]